MSGSDIHSYDDDVVLLSVDDLVLRGGNDARQFLRADLDGAALNGASPQGYRAEAASGGADRLIVAQERRLNGSCQVCPLLL